MEEGLKIQNGMAEWEWVTNVSIVQFTRSRRLTLRTDCDGVFVLENPIVVEHEGRLQVLSGDARGDGFQLMRLPVAYICTGCSICPDHTFERTNV